MKVRLSHNNNLPHPTDINHETFYANNIAIGTDELQSMTHSNETSKTHVGNITPVYNTFKLSPNKNTKTKKLLK